MTMTKAETLAELITHNRGVKRTVSYLEAENSERVVSYAELYERALGILPGHVAILTKLSELYVRDGQWTQAVDRLNHIVGQVGAPESARLDAHARLAAILDERLGEPDKARASVEAVLAVDLATGDRSIVSDVATGAGPLPTSFRGLAVEPELVGVVDGDDREVVE